MKKISIEKAFFGLLVAIMSITFIACTIIFFTSDVENTVGYYGYFFWVPLRPLVLSNHMVTILLTLTPAFIIWRARLIAPKGMIAAWGIFMFSSSYLGSTLDLYFVIWQWDKVMHAYSGGLLVILGFMLIKVMHKDNELPKGYSPMFISAAAFCFAMTVGVVWEIYEFSIDWLFDGNMQRWARQYLDGTRVPLEGQEALYDTMNDFMANMVGGIIVWIIGYLSLKKNGKFYNWMKFTKKPPREDKLII